ncbi:hypothetical protein Ga0074812_14124 [Parafrankia irregularis]|uniref:Uncharacterized protein n=1 Tax=Parafrankia irregularis TaxID=795642 RepID=A0A0S4QZ59_9ACTN|nr:MULTISPECIES: hypothetical protein [Parafrankia]MBE3200676.1 hypothetical protein [Parafrankia sp. CH37]CUU60505.1 hypothetical protein Ga0074812_14124 [Parafrankia irregularis]
MAPRNILIALGFTAVAVALFVIGAGVMTSRAGSDAVILAGVVCAVGALLSLARPSDREDGNDGEDGEDKAGSAGGTGRSHRP